MDTENAANAANTTKRAVIEADGLTKQYGDRVVVDNLSLRVDRGTIFGLLGPNGAGKTTTILMLLGLTEPTSGRALVLGLDPTRDPLAIKRRVGYLPDDVGFYPDMTARENLRYTARLNRIRRREADQVIEGLLRDVGLEAAADRRVGGFSRGMRQRLGLADALVKAPEILVLDEPTVNIDPVGVREIMGLVRHLRDERGITVMLSSHLLQQVQEVCDEVAMFIDGRMVTRGTVDQLTSGSQRGWSLDVTAVGPVDAVAKALASITEAEARHLDGPRWRVEASTDVRASVARALVHAGIAVTHLATAAHDLDEVYAQHAAAGTRKETAA